MFNSCLGDKCVFVLSIGVCFVNELGIQFFVNWYVFFVLWRGR